MKNQEIKIAANKRLAGLLGWSNLVEVGGALVGTPPAGAAESRGQAKVPDWAGDWAEAGPLIGKHGLMVESMGAGCVAGGVYVRFNAFPCHDAALRFAIVKSVAERLSRRAAADGAEP
jgi:hypothetical protein